MQYVGETTASKSAMEEAVNGIGSVQQLAGFPPECLSPHLWVLSLRDCNDNLRNAKCGKSPYQVIC